MKYTFPNTNDLSSYLDAIRDRPEFAVRRDTKSGIIVLNYVYSCSDSFPDPDSLVGYESTKAALRRECRGLKFDLKKETICARPYHKFFNVNEKPESMIGVIDWSQPHTILEKLDGSMIHPHRKFDGNLEWHTKMGFTSVAMQPNEYAKEHIGYQNIANECIDRNITPIFEWCSRQQRIVIDYPTERLVLTAARDNTSGEYMSYQFLNEMANKFNIPVVMSMGKAENIHDFIKETAKLKDAEGFVIRFDDGHMYKIKGEWYCRIHNTKEIFVFEKNVWELILNNAVDDAKPFMSDHDRLIMEAFSNEFDERVKVKAQQIANFVDESRKKNNDKKRFATEAIPALPAYDKGIAFKVWDGYDPVLVIRDFLSKHISTQSAVDSVRYMLGGLSWKQFYNNQEE